MKAAEMGNKEAYHSIGGAYFDGCGVEKDWEKAWEWYQNGANAGDVISRLQLADCYKRGAI